MSREGPIMSNGGPIMAFEVLHPEVTLSPSGVEGTRLIAGLLGSYPWQQSLLHMNSVKLVIPLHLIVLVNSHQR